MPKIIKNHGKKIGMKKGEELIEVVTDNGNIEYQAMTPYGTLPSSVAMNINLNNR